MNDPDDLYADAQRERASMRAWRWALAGLVVVLVASAAAFVYTGPLASGDDDPPTARAGIARPPVIPTIGSAVGGAEPAACRAPLTPEDPLRLWIGGDSLAGSLGPSLGAMAGETGVVQPTFHSKVSSGLVSRDFYDWPEHAPEDFAKYDPEVAVFWIGTNDAKSAPQDVADDDAWRDDYTVRVEEMLTTLIGEGRTVYWVGAPVMKDRSFAERVQVLNELAAAVVAKHPEARYVDAYTLFADPDGKYTASLPDEDGDPVLVRAGDGVHLTPDGGTVVGQAVYEHLQERCDLERQAVPDEAKETVEVRSGSQPSNRRPTTETAPSPPPTTAVTATAPTVVTTTPPTVTSVPITVPVTTRPPVSLPACVPFCTNSPPTTSR
jgi:hypothetical protein